MALFLSVGLQRSHICYFSLLRACISLFKAGPGPCSLESSQWTDGDHNTQSRDPSQRSKPGGSCGRYESSGGEGMASRRGEWWWEVGENQAAQLGEGTGPDGPCSRLGAGVLILNSSFGGAGGSFLTYSNALDSLYNLKVCFWELLVALSNS